MAYLQASGITKQFSRLVAVDDVSFCVEQNEIVSIIGPNGAGKTTVFNMLTGVYEVDKGEIVFEGKPIHNKAPQDIVEAGISRTFQNIRLFGDMRVIENVLIGMHIHTNYSFFDSLFRTPRFRRQEADLVVKAVKILRSIGLGGYIDNYAQSMPYGVQRKLEIARAIATDAKILLLDEPAAGMNPQETEEMMIFIRQLRDKGYTIVLIEHDMKVVMNISDRIYVLDHGKRIAEGLPREIAGNEKVIEAYLGSVKNDAEN